MSLFHSLFKTSDSPVVDQVKNALDLATYTASLASNPNEIDPLLDRVRKITATHSIESGLTADDEAELLAVYLKLEAYLTTHDPIRTFTKEELRNRLPQDLLTKLASQEMKGSI